jgi:16S rRNA (cytosine1402-N4)-methyltransferase
MEFKHKPIMVTECIEGLKIRPNGIYVDGTVGGAGHSKQIVAKLNQEGLLVGIDRDIEAINAAAKTLNQVGKRFILVHDNFSSIREIVNREVGQLVDGILLDLGVSSYQLDNAERGFSYQADAPLDMRMDKSQSLTAEMVVNQYTKEKLLQIISSYGEERWAKRIVEFIAQCREEQKIKTTGELVEIIKKAIPKGARQDGPHPAKRTFQAIRIEVNSELSILKDAIINAVESLKSEGRIAIITFHSLEDRIVKQTFSELEGKCTCPKDLPLCVCHSKSYGKIVNKKPIEPLKQEVEENPRARSSKLRIFQRK